MGMVASNHSLQGPSFTGTHAGNIGGEDPLPQAWPLASGKDKQSWILVRAVGKTLFHNNYCNKQEGPE